MLPKEPRLIQFELLPWQIWPAVHWEMTVQHSVTGLLCLAQNVIALSEYSGIQRQEMTGLRRIKQIWLYKLIQT